MPALARTALRWAPEVEKVFKEVLEHQDIRQEIQSCLERSIYYVLVPRL